VFVVGADGIVERRTVQPAATVGDQREIASGLAPGETVVVDPADELSDGTKVSTGAASAT